MYDCMSKNQLVKKQVFFRLLEKYERELEKLILLEGSYFAYYLHVVIAWRTCNEEQMRLTCRHYQSFYSIIFCQGVFTFAEFSGQCLAAFHVSSRRLERLFALRRR